MNFLAHIFLSHDHPEITIGNFIGDFVKGNDLSNYPEEIEKGIQLHRNIDEYTDRHPIVLQSKVRLRPVYRHYAPVIVDMFYDHFLAINFSEYSSVPLVDFSANFYTLTEKFSDFIPDPAKNMLYYMKKGDWLYNYQFLEGLQQALTGMSRRTKFDSKMEKAVQSLKEDYTLYEEEFRDFFPDLQNMSKQFLLQND